MYESPNTSRRLTSVRFVFGLSYIGAVGVLRTPTNRTASANVLFVLLVFFVVTKTPFVSVTSFLL
jgi:hypothetical protein